MSSRRQIKIPIKGDNKKTTQKYKKKTQHKVQADVSPGSLSRTSSQAATRQDLLCSPVPPLLFSVGSFRQKFGSRCPTSTWWTGFRGSFRRRTFLFLTAGDAGFWRGGSGGRAGVTEHVTHNGYSHTHARTPALILSALLPLCLPHFASPSSRRCPFATSRGGRPGNAGGVGRGETKE